MKMDGAGEKERASRTDEGKREEEKEEGKTENANDENTGGGEVRGHEGTIGRFGGSTPGLNIGTKKGLGHVQDMA